MKRFWTDVAVTAGEGGHGISLDGRAVKTPARAALVVPNAGLAEAIAEEWRAVGETLDPRAMPLTGLANAAIDRVAPDPAAFAATLARYGEGDLLCYRANHPESLVSRQAATWDPLLDWARDRYGIEFAVTDGIAHVAQPGETPAVLARALGTLDPLRLAAMSPLVTIGGSLVTALALADGAIDVDTAWAAVSLDDAFQLEKWGADAEAVAALALREADFRAAARFLALA